MTADLIIRDANVYTMVRPGRRAEALAFQAGRIVVVGANAEVEALVGPQTQVLSLPGRTVLPGFIDCHVHMTQTGLGALGTSVYDVSDTGTVLQVVAEAVDRAAPGEAVLVHGCWFGGLDRPVIAADLDRIAPRNPVMVADVSGHGCLVSSPAWEALALPSGIGGVLRDGSGCRSGRLVAEANTLARYRYYASIDDAQRAEALQRAAEMALRVGITTLHALDGGCDDGHSWFRERDAAMLLQAQDHLPVRTVLYLQSTCVETAVAWGLSHIGGCVWLDGSYGDHTTALLEPYADRPDTCGKLYFADDELEGFVERAHLAGLQIAMHAIGDAAIQQLLDAYEKVLVRHPRADHRHRIEHFSLPTVAQIDRAARLGVALSMQPNQAVVPKEAHQHMPASMRYLGPERYARRHPYRRILDAGCLVGGGSDSDPKPMGPLIGVEALAGHPDDDRHLSAYEALLLYTASAARLAFEEDQKGTLEPGKLADCVVLSADPLAADPDTISQIPVDMTLVAGRIAYRRPGNDA
ncbi:MAG TPA: amidohydrolase [Anaerolineae bacterium]|nr:amidohydrolase [Anaerolineae bacterium]